MPEKPNPRPVATTVVWPLAVLPPTVLDAVVAEQNPKK
jgi:hypothetical protein